MCIYISNWSTFIKDIQLSRKMSTATMYACMCEKEREGEGERVGYHNFILVNQSAQCAASL